MVVKSRVLKNVYRDSIALMRIASAISQRTGVARAEVLMATPANLEALHQGALFTPEMAGASASDIAIVVEAVSDDVVLDVLGSVDDMLRMESVAETGGSDGTFSLPAAIEQRPDANLALLSIPGLFVKREAMRALERGLNLLIFSDNVPLEDEIELKRQAEARGLLVMGPDCGTALIGGVALGFANRVRRGSIGIVAASGTGLQEVSCLLDRAGLGVSHGIGTGTNDVKAAVGGVSLLRGLRLLEADADTDIIVIVTKPPDGVVAAKILAEIKKVRKRVIVNFLGGDVATITAAGATPAVTLEDAARLAVEAAGGIYSPAVGDWSQLPGEMGRLAPTQRYVRGVFSGGTLAAEAALVLAEQFGEVYTNTSLTQARRMPDARRSLQHTCVDLGDDEFTRGRPHPMLEPAMRHQRILQEAEDPETAVLLLDVVLGYGIHPYPARVLAETLREARERVAKAGHYLPVVASVCGTEGDPQSCAKQAAALRQAGALVFCSNAQSARAAAAIAQRRVEGWGPP